MVNNCAINGSATSVFFYRIDITSGLIGFANYTIIGSILVNEASTSSHARSESADKDSSTIITIFVLWRFRRKSE